MSGFPDRPPRAMLAALPAPAEVPMPRLHPNALGALYMSLSMLGFALNDAAMKFVSEAAPLFQLLLSLAALGVCLACAALFWRLFEKPAVDAARRLGRQPGRARPASA